MFHAPFNNTSSALLTDFYQMTMAYSYWKLGLDSKEAVFHLFFRRNPFKGGYAIAAGLEQAIHFLENFHFEKRDLDYLSTLKGEDGEILFDPAFFDYLANLKFSCHVDAVPEGTPVFPYEPLLRIQGPLLQCQLLESPLLNQINFSTLIATKASRICLAAGEDPVLEFGLRRAQGFDGAMTASRAAFIGGCDATSNVLAGKRFGIPVKGTHSHSWVMAFDDELESFYAFAKCMPNNCILLVDTYNTLEGVKKVIEVAKKLKAENKKILGIRLDSGDLAYLSIKSREMLDLAGLNDVLILASNELDEVLISELKHQGAKIDSWGVGTHLITGKEQAALDGVYKLSAIRDPQGEWKYKLKLSEQMIKVSNPGILQVRRYSKLGEHVADAIYDIHEDVSQGCLIIDPFDQTRKKILSDSKESQDLLQPIFKDGKRVYEVPSLEAIKAHAQKELKKFHPGVKRFYNPHQYVVGMEKSLYDLKVSLIDEIRKGLSS